MGTDDSDAWDGNSESRRAQESSVCIDDTSFFDCNLCFRMATDPVVTICGHLFCWPCIYQWKQQQQHVWKQQQQQHSTLSTVHPSSTTCPVCSGSIDGQYEIVPIYGRGKAATSLHEEEEEEGEPEPEPEASPSSSSSSFSHDVATKSNLLLTSTQMVRRRRTTKSSQCDGSAGGSSSSLEMKIPPRPHAHYISRASNPRRSLWTYVAYLKDSFAPLLLLLQTIGFVISYELSDPA